jgi:hypothetical protein
MFGLMRAKKCGMTDEEKHLRRLNYCGTCKTIGSLYGHKSRFLLDHDTVFLAEFLTGLSGENVLGRQKSYQSFNCLDLPEKEMPDALRFAATANLVLAEFKLADHISDEGKTRYKFAFKTFSKEFAKAGRLLRSWRFPLDEVKAILRTQPARERETATGSAEEILENLAAPTAQVTAIFFRQGVNLIGRNELAATAGKIGFAFGKLIYLIDAFEDFEKDALAGQFNAVRAAFRLNDAKIGRRAKRRTIALASALEAEIRREMARLPLPENQKALFAARLQSNLSRKLRTNLPVAAAKNSKKSCAPSFERAFGERWRNAKETAQKMARGFSWQMPLVFLFVFVFALAAPAQTKEAKSARECFDLSFNLMFLGAIFGAAAAFPKTVRMRNAKKKSAKQAAADGDGSADGCCDSCDCCCCACDACDSGCDCGVCDGCACDGCCDGCDCCSCDC